MDFEFTPDERAFEAEVIEFLDANYDPVVMDLTRENFTQLVDTPERRAFMKKLAAKGWLGMTWPKQYGGGEREGVYEYILNEALARYGAPQIGKGVGIIGKSGLRLAPEYRAHDAERRFEVEDIVTQESPLCISGKILKGLAKPSDCAAFGTKCTPAMPLGATMVSQEGACSAYYQYGRLAKIRGRQEATP